MSCRKEEEMSVEIEGPADPETLVRRDSFYGDAEKVSVDKHHGSGVSNSANDHLNTYVPRPAWWTCHYDIILLRGQVHG
jgi:hypothetical protein